MAVAAEAAAAEGSVVLVVVGVLAVVLDVVTGLEFGRLPLPVVKAFAVVAVVVVIVVLGLGVIVVVLGITSSVV